MTTWVRATLLGAACFATACGSCGRGDGKRDAGPPPPLVPASLPALPRPWTFATVRDPSGFALPVHCTERLPRVAAPVESTTRFVADPRTLAALAVADMGGQPPTVTGAGALTLDPAGPSRDPKQVPWFDPSVPRLARTGDGWIGAFERPGSTGTRVALWRGIGGASPTSAEEVGDGDGFEPLDLACGATRCALLTTRLTRVAAPGAEIRVGEATAPIASWKRIEIAPSKPDSDAEPIGLGAVEPGLVAVLSEDESAVFWDAEAPSPREIARLPAPHGVLDAIAAPTPMALVYGTDVGEDGCARGVARVRFERAGAPGIDVATPSAPLAASLRRLSRGALATWIAALGCGVARQVVFAVVLGPDGAPASEPMAVADGTSFAVATAGDDVDLWIQAPTSVTWIRARCTAP